MNRILLPVAALAWSGLAQAQIPTPAGLWTTFSDSTGKPVVGMVILRGLRPDGNNYGGGTILDPDEGRTYRCMVVLLEGGRQLEVRGCLGFPWLGRAQTWVRAIRQ